MTEYYTVLYSNAKPELKIRVS